MTSNPQLFLDGLARGYDAYHRTPCRKCGCYAGDHLFRLSKWARLPVLGRCAPLGRDCRCPKFERQR